MASDMIDDPSVAPRPFAAARGLKRAPSSSSHKLGHVSQLIGELGLLVVSQVERLGRPKG